MIISRMRARGWTLAMALMVVAPTAGADGAKRSAQPLKSHQGIEVARRLLASDSEESRLRGIERLGAVGTVSALAELVEALDDRVGNNAKGRLVAARALAPHARQEVARQALVQLMTGAGTDEADGLTRLVRSTAALALADSGSPEALRALAHAIRTEGPAGEAAADALLAHPPRDLDALLGRRGGASVAWVRLLAQLGDQRAFLRVRQAITAGPADVRGAAAVALTRLGALETIDLARHWHQNNAGPALSRAAAEILVITRAPEAPAAIARLLEDETHRDLGLDLALQSGAPPLVKPLTQLLERAPSADTERILAAMGRCGTAEAVRFLEQRLTDENLQSAAAYALAQSEGKEARAALDRALQHDLTRRLAARAAVVRELTLADAPRRTKAVLEELVESSSAADRYVGAWGLSSLDPRRAEEWLAGDDAELALAAAATLRDPDVARAAAQRLNRAEGPRERTALAIALILSDGAAPVPTATLRGLIADGSAATPLAAQALAARDAPRERLRIERLLESGDAAIRAHTALGLGSSTHPSAVGLLEDAYRFEADPSVRRAIVIALGMRRESTRDRVLSLAARLDGDAQVRSAARLGLAGQKMDLVPHGPAAVWLRVKQPKSSPEEDLVVALRLPTGQTLPLALDPEGFVVLGNLPRGPIEVRVATLPGRDQARSPKESNTR